MASKHRRAFVLVELIVVAVVLTVVAALLAVGTANTRRLAGTVAPEENLHRLAQITTSYAADNADLYWAYSWKAGDAFSQWPDLNHAASDNAAHANQAVDVIRRKVDPNFPLQQTWLPDVFYSDLVLSDYLDETLPLGFVASLADSQLRGWQTDPASAPNVRLPYSSSYELPTSFYDKSDAGNRISSGGTHNTFLIPGGCKLGARRVSEVSFPSQKAHVYDRYQRHFGSRIGFFAYKEVRLPILFADGAVDVRKTGDGNQGWDPNSPNNPNPLTYLYQPMAWEPPTLSGQQSEVVYGYLRWTRNGIGGRDFGGPDVTP